MRILELFSGYGTASFALKQLGIPYECVGYSDIDKYANQCFQQNHKNEIEIYDNYNKNFKKDGCIGTLGSNCGCFTATGSFSIIGNQNPKELGDCTKINPNDLEDFDLLTGGFPCQSFSVAGKGKGELDPRGTLFNEIIRIAEIKKPRYMLLENVKGLTNKKHVGTFKKILSELKRIGYKVHWKVLNTKDYGIPQNRERVFFVCFRGFEDSNYWGGFPEKEELKIFLKDILEEEVDEKYYLSEKQVKILCSKERAFNERFQGKCVCGSLLARDYKDPKCINMDIIKQIGMINQTCKKRVYDTPKEINEFLREYKLPFTLQQIADKINIPKTQVEHYFRLDKSRAIPSPESWNKLKDFLNFPNTYDKQVTEIYEKEIEFESTRRVYSDEGVSPTISSTNADKIIQVNNPTHSNNRVYSDEGVSPSLNTMQGGNRQPFIAASRGRNIENPSDRTPGNKVEQRLEPKTDGTSNTISTVQKDNYVCIKNATKKGYQEAESGDGINFEQPNSKTRRGRVQKQISSTLQCNDARGVLTEDYKIRKLTPKECFRLQGFVNDEINLEGLSNTQRYKLAGNGQSVNVVKKIFEQMFALSESSEVEE